MSRRRRAGNTSIIPDSVYGSATIARLVNVIMERGKKATAQKVVYGALDMIRQREETDNPVEVLERAIDNVKPRLEVKSRRVGGATYQVPMEVSGARQTSLALRWLVGFARSKRGVPMGRALAGELLDAYKETGSAIKKRDETHKMAQANRAFAHYRW
jgi:small subunit ribosomal protein S7